MKLKRTLMTALALVALNAAFAQNYKQLWEKAGKAMDKDLPKTALAEIRGIYSQAARQGNTGEMLKAAVCALQMQWDISPDSAKAEIKNLDSIAVSEKRPAERALWMLVAAKMHTINSDFRDPTEGNRAVECILEATKDLTVFNNRKAAEFMPAVKKGGASKYYNGDLLSVVCRNAANALNNIRNTSYSREEIRQKLHDIESRFIGHYRKTGNADAVVLATLDSLSRNNHEYYFGKYNDTTNTSYTLARKLMEQYVQSPCAVEAYIYICGKMKSGECETEDLRYSLAKRGAQMYAKNPRSAVLRNIMKEMKTQNVFARFVKNAAFPGETLRGEIKADNTGKMEIQMFRLPYTAMQINGNSELARKFKPGAKDKIAVYTKSVTPDKELFHFKDSFSYSAPAEPGVYLLKNAQNKDADSYCILYVSNLRTMFLPLPDNRMRISVVDARSGKPIAGAKVNEYDARDGKMKASYTTNGKGEVVMARSNYSRYNAENGNDKSCPFANFYGYAYFPSNNEKNSEEYRLFTDRAVYRPSQKVCVGGIVFKQKGDDFNTVYDKKIKLTLTDPNNKVMSTQEVNSDEFGAFGADFTLPATVMPGYYYINANGENSVEIRIEEYKRPTFEVTTEKPKEKFALGDTISVKGRATAFTGVGVSYAKVSYKVRKTSFSWFYRETDNDIIASDTTTADSEGNFTMRVPIEEDPEETGAKIVPNITYMFTVTATVTSGAGETQEAQINLSAGKRAAILSCDIPQRIEKGNIPAITFALRNILQEQTEGKGKYSIYKGLELCAEGAFTANEPIEINSLANLSSGKYTLHTQLDGETDTVYDLKKSFILFSVNDTQAADPAERIRLYSPNESFTDGKATVSIASSLNDVTAFYDVIANGKLVESRQIALSNSAEKLVYDYKEEYNDGISIVLGFMKDGELYKENITIKKALPNKTLKYKWTSFRDRLRPNQKEEWRLQICEPDGTPAKISALATIYDASLDKFAKNYWYSPIYLSRYVPSVIWSTFNRGMSFNHYYNPFKREKTAGLQFDELVMYYPFPDRQDAGKDVGVDVVDLKEQITEDGGNKLSTSTVRFAARGMAKAAANSAVALETSSGAQEAPTQKTLRENFAETAYFSPALRSDENGNLTIAFTTPESMTRWNVKVLAHTKAMNFVEADTTATVTKEFMVQPNMPRFLRIGDNATIPATLKNLSRKALSGKAVMTMQDAENLAIIKQESVKFSVGANGETVVAFPFKAVESLTTPLLICKITADCGTFADGEQHYLPLFSDKVEVIASLPFTIKGSGNHTVSIADTLTGSKAGATNRRLTIEYTSNPTWLALQALPSIDTPKWEDALTLAASYYAASLEHEIATISPEIKEAAKRWANEQTADTLLENALLRNQDLKNAILAETPWAANADNISLRRRSLARTFDELQSGARERNLEERLARLQREDGGFGWFPNMPSSRNITSGITTVLLRLNSITGKTPATNITDKAIKYLDGKVAQDIAKMKKEEKKGIKPSVLGSHLDYLNILRMSKGKLSAQASANRKYLLPILQKHYSDFNITAKAKAALVLNDAGYTKEAMTVLKSILEHTVSDKTKGIYFDSFNAPSFWNSYKIPTQVAALEAVRTLTPGDKATQEGMLTWILQSKRTQGWETALNTVDAVYALLSTTKTDTSLVHFGTARPQNFSLNLQNGKSIDIMQNAKTADEKAVGYVRSDLALDELKSSPKSVSISKTDGGMSWGGIYSRYLAPAQNVEKGGGELTVNREYFLVKDGRETALANGASIKTGDRVRVRYTINAARDFDYVSLADPRPACLEPAMQISGYTCTGGEWFYLAVRDASQALFLESMKKGKHIITLDFHADRKGTYLAAPASVQCLYSPEFAGRSNGRTINVKQDK